MTGIIIGNPELRYLEVNAEEYEILKKQLDELRAEKYRQELIESYKARFCLVINESIHDIGIEDTKRIVRELGRNLKGNEEE